MRTGYDSVTAANIPAVAEVVLGYIDGRYAWSAVDWARFPTTSKGRIAAHASTNNGQILDVEKGDASPVEAPGWCLMRRAHGVDPTVYCSEAVWDAVRRQFAAQRVAEPHWWIAAYPGIGKAIYPGSVAHQYTDAGPYDVSVVADFWPGVDNQGDTVLDQADKDWILQAFRSESISGATDPNFSKIDDAVENVLGPKLDAILAAVEKIQPGAGPAQIDGAAFDAAVAQLRAAVGR